VELLPVAFLESLQGIPGFEEQAFKEAHATGEEVTTIRINPCKQFNIHDTEFKIEAPVPWSQNSYYLKERPSFTFDPFFHAGCYYVQDASGMFLEQALKQTIDLSQPLRVLDLCGAPGGKSTHIQSLISPQSLLVTNEVIKSRSRILRDNIIKWGCDNVIVTNNDPKDFKMLPNYFDVIVIDAPCSGSGLFRKDHNAIGEWSINNVQLCSQRQQRILSDVLPALKKNGILIYSTCSYSKEEDEDIVDWLADEFGVYSCKLAIGNDSGIVEVVSKIKKVSAYRFFPDKVKGEGFFISVFRKSEGKNEETKIKSKYKLSNISKNEIPLLLPWVKKTDHHLLKQNNTVVVMQQGMLNDLILFLERFRVEYFGTRVGKLMRDKLVPDHALAMSPLAADKLERNELNYEQSIMYLKRKEIRISTNNKGWQIVCYQGYPLGWINALTNRINNYYPKELRILKDK
jgi:16S rRNA C967 or C1407 C5-methylase (RsmB/RsmF family)/NOL1/NOP2/fmu family ribosome biogenesis protein